MIQNNNRQDNITTFNPTQVHLLKMFSYARTEQALDDVRRGLVAYFAQRVNEGMDQLWDEGKWSQEINEAILNEHLRTPYTR